MWTFIGITLAIIGQVSLFLVLQKGYWREVGRLHGWIRSLFLVTPVFFSVFAVYSVLMPALRGVPDAAPREVGVICAMSWLSALVGTVWSYGRFRFRQRRS